MLLKHKRNPGLRLAIATGLFFLLTLLLSLHRHFTFYSSYDQGIFNQVFWNSLHGRFFESSLSSALSTNVIHNGEVPAVNYHRLGQHFTPALLLWLPIYALFPYPATLSVIQVTLITTAGLILYILARQYLKPAVALRITVSFYCANAVIGPTLSNFHDICQIPLFVFSLLLAMEKGWWRLFWILAILILVVREDSGITLFGVGTYLIISKRYPRIGFAVCCLSLFYMLILTNTIMPLFSADISKRFMLEKFGQYVTKEEASTLEILWSIIKNPKRLVVELFTPWFGTLKYLISQWLPLAFVPAVAPVSWIVAGFPLLKLFLSQGQSVLAINIRYAMSVVPGLFYGAILWWGGHGFKNLSGKLEYSKPKKLSSLFRRFWVACISLSLFFSLISSPHNTFYFLFPDSYHPWVYVSLPEQWGHSATIRDLLTKIPANDSVSATTYIIPHLSGRREIIRLPALELRNDRLDVVKVKYAIADLRQLQRYQVAFKEEREILQTITALIDQVTANQEYGIIDFKNGVILLKKGALSNLEATSAWLTFRQGMKSVQF
jgi:uncharacterized membrane protein